MSWNFKLTEAEYVAQHTVICARVDEAVGPKMRKYFEIFEAGALENIFGRLNEADLACTESQDWDTLAGALEQYLAEMQAAAKRVSRELTNNEKARIHILKAESGVSDAEYRELIRRIGGVESSRDLSYWEGMILIRALSRIKEREHDKAV